MSNLLPLIMIVLIWTVLVVPQRRKMKAQQQALQALGPGDEVVTTSGIYGRIVASEDDVVTLNVAPGVDLRVARRALMRRVGESAAASAARSELADDHEDNEDKDAA